MSAETPPEFDESLVDLALSLTPEERLRQHERALLLYLELARVGGFAAVGRDKDKISLHGLRLIRDKLTKR